jgi:nitrate reductase / nitrite oxidoreductase, beta subunit
MAKVFNWQVGREMEYVYDGPKPKKQVAYVFDINKCIACQTCTVACKTCWTSGKGQETIFYNNVETKPYGGYPVAWDNNLLEKSDPAVWRVGEKDGHKLVSLTVFESQPPNQTPLGYRPKPQDYATPNLGEDDLSGMIDGGELLSGEHSKWMFYLARICNHCDHPACLAACSRQAIYKREEDGIVLVDQERCRGYQECTLACPYKKVFFNLVSRSSEKCIGCFPRVEEGNVALCVESCAGKIRLHGFFEGQPDENNPLDYIVRIRKLALPIYPQFGTGPNVYYIPPIHVGGNFLEQMFGPGVDQAKALYRNLSQDRKLLGAMLLFGATTRILTRFEIQGDEVVGWDIDGVEAARVPFTEPFYERSHYDEKHDVYRQSLP